MYKRNRFYGKANMLKIINFEGDFFHGLLLRGKLNAYLSFPGSIEGWYSEEACPAADVFVPGAGERVNV